MPDLVQSKERTKEYINGEFYKVGCEADDLACIYTAEELAALIRFICLAMSDQYIENHFSEIFGRASEIESRFSDADCTMESLKTDNRKVINGFRHAAEQIILIDSDYEQTIKELLNSTTSSL